MDKLIYILRHGETDFNKMRMMQGKSINAPLNDTGFIQAEKFFNFYRVIPFNIVYSSDLLRSIQSVQGFIDLGIKHVIDPRIAEISWGIHEGQTFNEEMLITFRKMIDDWCEGNMEACIPQGETGKELFDRLSDFAAYLKQSNHKSILISTHGRALKMLLTILLEEPLAAMETYHHDNTGLYILRLDQNKFTLVKNNDTEHLNTFPTDK